MKKNILLKCLLVGAITSVGAFAEMTVDKSNGVLIITSDTSGTGIAQIVGPDNNVIVSQEFQRTFTWTPSGADGAYRYDVRVEGDYAGGSVEVVHGQIYVSKDKGVLHEK